MVVVGVNVCKKLEFEQKKSLGDEKEQRLSFILFFKFDPAGKRTWDLFDLFTYIFCQFAAELEQLLKHKNEFKLSSSEFEPGKTIMAHLK